MTYNSSTLSQSGRSVGDATTLSSVTSKAMPVLVSRELVPFPHVMLSLSLERPLNIRAVELANEDDNLVFLVAQRNQDDEHPTSEGLYRVGVVANVTRHFKLADGRYKVLFQGLMRARVQRYQRRDGCLMAQLTTIEEQVVDSVSDETGECVARIHKNLQELVEREYLPEEMLLMTEEIEDPGVLSDLIIAHFKLETGYAQEVLEELDSSKRIEYADRVILDELNQCCVSESIRDQTDLELTKGQREFYLREQLRQIQRELGEEDAASEDLVSLRKALADLQLPEHAAMEAQKQVIRLERMHPETSEYAMLRTYLEWITDLPWSTKTRDRLNLTVAAKVLNEDHFGLDQAKDRILEYLSVRKLKRDSRGPILCFVGPPGVGKTSLGRSIARCLGRRFVRMSLGGVRDEAEIRGHRRTYVGALPGRILQGFREAGSCNPVFLLDELDKVGADFRGDPAAALLEILDPEQNSDFRDHYLNISYDLSQCLFLATANTTDTIPDALLDRLEVIYLSGYTTEEKVQIAERFLVPKQRQEQGFHRRPIEFTEEAIQFIIERYTREAGLRGLEQQIAAVLRRLARRLAGGESIPARADNDLVREILGVTKYDPEQDQHESLPGLVRGLAWTVHGGEVMPIEASVAKGKGNLTLTGQLGDVMQESAKAALFYARANAGSLGLAEDFHETLDVHVHVPSGATPKDGPSAGITIATAMISALSHRPTAAEYALTGEMTLRGNVLPVGGVKEKALAALRQGIPKVIIPRGNLKDLEDIPDEQQSKLTFIPVRHIGEVLDLVLLPAP